MIDFRCREGVFFDFLDIIKIQIREEIPGEGEVVMEKRVSTRSIVITGMFAAVIAVLAQVALPMPSGVPVTLQTFAIALTGVVLGAKLGMAAAGVYIWLWEFRFFRGSQAAWGFCLVNREDLFGGSCFWRFCADWGVR